MAQKVITATGFADAPAGKFFQELEFPKVTAALAEGYEIKQIHQSSMGDKIGWFLITFVLEKPKAKGGISAA